jgi:RHH-type proline utilization regulon transcriptional repressor/proline dehydrogenase/delta 1-pyrroline-5-carboxylate dehydrogenase
LVSETLRLPGAAALQLQLPCVAGETNELLLRPRGVLLCFSALSKPINSLAAQVLLSVATGNAVLAVVSTANAQALRELIALLQQSGVPENLIACIELPHAELPHAWLTSLDIDGVAFDGSEVDTQRVAAYLQQRSGALLPLLDSGTDAYRFCLEQTITVNTAAAGGDPHLLGIAT